MITILLLGCALFITFLIILIASFLLPPMFGKRKELGKGRGLQ